MTWSGSAAITIAWPVDNPGHAYAAMASWENNTLTTANSTAKKRDGRDSFMDNLLLF